MGGSDATGSSAESATAEVRNGIALAASVAGLAGYVYLIGGLVEWMRLATAGVPADALTAVVDQKVLFAIGLKATLGMALLLAAVCLVCYFVGGFRWRQNRPEWHAAAVHGPRKAARLSNRERQAAEARLGDGAVRTVAGLNTIVLSALVGLWAGHLADDLFPTQGLVVLAVLISVTFVAWRLATWGPLRRLGTRRVVTVALAVLAVLFVAAPIGVLVLASLAVTGLARTIANLRRPQSVTGFLRSPLPWGLLTVYALVALAYVAQPPVEFPRAVLMTASGSQTGGWVARTSDGVYLVTCRGLADATSRDARGVLVPAAGVKATTLGGEPYRVDPGTRPSLAAAAFGALGIHARPHTWFRVDLRARDAACGGDLPAGTTDRGLGVGVLVGPAPPGGQASDGEAPIAQTSPALAQLARRFQPTLEVTAADGFWPVSVASVLRDRGTIAYALLHHGRRGTCLVHGGKCGGLPPTLADLTPIGADGSDALDFPATLDHGNPTSEFQAYVRGQGVPEQTIGDWLADPAALNPWRSAQIYFYDAGVGGYSDRYRGAPPGLRNLQYWFFYPYNYYPFKVAQRQMPTAPVAAMITNVDLHEGDWEHVSVLLDPKTLEPRYLYMARHDQEGVTLPWDSPELAFDDGHPIVQAALGGHPSYPNRCAEHPRAIARNLISDWVVCGSGRFAFRAETTPLVDLARASWGCWPGHFGEATAAQLRAAKLPEYDPRRAIAKYLAVAGPLSPLRQAENANVCRAAPR